jgi:hypothetical protein
MGNRVRLKRKAGYHNFSGTIYGPGRVRVVKLILTAGTTQACSGGHPASLIGLRQSDAVAGATCEGKTVLSSGSAYT